MIIVKKVYSWDAIRVARIIWSYPPARTQAAQAATAGLPWLSCASNWLSSSSSSCSCSFQFSLQRENYKIVNLISLFRREPWKAKLPDSYHRVPTLISTFLLLQFWSYLNHGVFFPCGQGANSWKCRGYMTDDDVPRAWLSWRYCGFWQEVKPSAGTTRGAIHHAESVSHKHGDWQGIQCQRRTLEEKKWDVNKDRQWSFKISADVSLKPEPWGMSQVTTVKVTQSKKARKEIVMFNERIIVHCTGILVFGQLYHCTNGNH